RSLTAAATRNSIRAGVPSRYSESRMPHATQMSAADTGLLVIDVQEKLMAKIPAADAVVRNIAFLIDSGRLLGMPVAATEQYPKGLGPTVPELARRLPERPDKVAFSWSWASCATSSTP